VARCVFLSKLPTAIKTVQAAQNLNRIEP